MLAKKRQQRTAGDRAEVIGVQPWYSMGLRWDDGDLLRSLSAEFGGATRYQSRSESAGSQRRGRVIWTVGAKQDMLGLLDYFAEYPLRGKKRFDYEIWAEAVLIYVEHGARHEALPLLRDRLLAQRQSPPVIDEIAAAS